MPIFEFECSSCSQQFEELVMSQEAESQVVCPECGSEDNRKLISTFASRTSGSSSFSLGSSSMSSCVPGGT
jgi:putative FmdB family regulatory protein